MIRSIAAVDDELGLATDGGIPWSAPADVAHFRAATARVDVLMGYATYVEFEHPMPDCVNYVATRRGVALREGFRPVGDVWSFLSDDHPGDIWIIGGATLYATTLGMTDELHLTRVQGDFDCTKFFPPFEATFQLATETTPPRSEGACSSRFQTWTPRAPFAR